MRMDHPFEADFPVSNESEIVLVRVKNDGWSSSLCSNQDK